MDFKKIDQALQDIIKCRAELKTIDYSSPKYDEVEEHLHDMEDDFQDTFGDDMEEILQDVHDEYCPDSEVLLPIAYLAQNYTINDKNGFSVGPGEGVYVEVDDYAGKDTKLALVPAPLRIVLSIGKEKQEVVWTAPA
jgi:hypothetical protein